MSLPEIHNSKSKREVEERHKLGIRGLWPVSSEGEVLECAKNLGVFILQGRRLVLSEHMFVESNTDRRE